MNIFVNTPVSILFGQHTSSSKSLILSSETPQPSSGSYMLHQKISGDIINTDLNTRTPYDLLKTIGTSFLGFDFNDNITETSGWMFIPPDIIGAAGTDRLIAVGNVVIEARDKSGTLLWIDALKDFFSPTGGIGTLGTFTFDPKVVFDHYENRFLVISLERTDTYYGDPSNQSRILLAVSKTATPASATSTDWWYYAIDSKINISGNDCWADYPGFEIDEEAIYITNNMFRFRSLGGNFSGVRLWIVDKGVSTGFYSGGAVSWSIYNPYSGGGTATTTMPALIYGSGGAGSGIGTYLVSYSGLSSGVNDLIQVVRVNNPLGSILFYQEYVNVGDMDNSSTGMPNAPQITDPPADVALIETNDRRVLDAVWRNGQLWFTTTVVPGTGADADQATAHWVKLAVSSGTWPPTLTDRGHIGGEDIHTNGEVHTFFPSLAVNNEGDVYFGFSASSADIYCGAYCAGRKSGDAAGTVGASETVRAGDDYYQRTFGTYPDDRNRWGDYSGAALDPTDENLFWIFNEYAITRGNGTAPENGRWGTAWASVSFVVETEFTNGANVTLNFTQTNPSPSETDWPFGQFSLNSSTTQATLNSVTVTLSGTYSGLAGSNPFRLFALNTDDFASASAIGTDAAESGGTVTFNSLNDDLPSGTRYYWITADLSGSAEGTINGTIGSAAALNITNAEISGSYGLLNSGSDVSLPIELTSFSASVTGGQVVLNWTTETEVENVGFVVERSVEELGSYMELSSFQDNPDLEGQGNSATVNKYHFIDKNIEPIHTYFYKIVDVEINGARTYHGPISVTIPEWPEKYALYQNYPNPFNPNTTIEFDIPKISNVNLKIYNSLGQEVATVVNKKLEPGKYKYDWNVSPASGAVPDGRRAQGFASGVYFYRIIAGDPSTGSGQRFSQVNKMLLIK